MPWYLYVCEKCGKTARRKRSIAYRDVAGKHVDEGGCGEGELRRSSAITGPANAPEPAAADDPDVRWP